MSDKQTHGQRVRHCETASLELRNYISEWSVRHGLFQSEGADILLEIVSENNSGLMRLQRYGNYEKPDWDESIVRTK